MKKMYGMANVIEASDYCLRNDPHTWLRLYAERDYDGNYRIFVSPHKWHGCVAVISNPVTELDVVALVHYGCR